jgi:hypothetical protein
MFPPKQIPRRHSFRFRAISFHPSILLLLRPPPSLSPIHRDTQNKTVQSPNSQSQVSHKGSLLLWPQMSPHQSARGGDESRPQIPFRPIHPFISQFPIPTYLCTNSSSFSFPLQSTDQKPLNVTTVGGRFGQFWSRTI